METNDMAQFTLERDGPVAVLTFNNPPDGYMDNATVPEIAAVVSEVEKDDAIRAVVFTGAQEGVFIRHYSIVDLAERARDMQAKGLEIDLDHTIPERDLHTTYRRIEESAKPYVAAINGTAMGGGFELALRCDIRVVQDGPYWLGLPEVNLGILPGAGGTQKLARLVGETRALEMMLLGRTVSPQEAAAIGIVSECCKGPVLERGLAYARELAGKSSRAIAHIKWLARNAHRMDPLRGLAEERTRFADLMTTEEALRLMTEMNEGKRDIRDR
jgi:enoyl-CoA hydratase